MSQSSAPMNMHQSPGHLLYHDLFGMLTRFVLFCMLLGEKYGKMNTHCDTRYDEGTKVPRLRDRCRICIADDTAQRTRAGSVTRSDCPEFLGLSILAEPRSLQQSANILYYVHLRHVAVIVAQQLLGRNAMSFCSSQVIRSSAFLDRWKRFFLPLFYDNS